MGERSSDPVAPGHHDPALHKPAVADALHGDLLDHQFLNRVRRLIEVV